MWTVCLALARRIKAAAPRHAELLAMLAGGERAVTALHADRRVPMRNTSCHLATIRRGGLVTRRGQGRGGSSYSLTEAAREMVEMLGRLDALMEALGEPAPG